MTTEEYIQRKRELLKGISKLNAEYLKSCSRYGVGDVLMVTFPWGSRQVIKHCVITHVDVNDFGRLYYNARFAYRDGDEWQKEFGACSACFLDNLNGTRSRYFNVCGYQFRDHELYTISMKVVGKWRDADDDVLNKPL